MHDSIFEHEINIFSIKEIYLMAYNGLGLFIIRITRYYFPLFSVNLLSVKLSLKLHMDIIVQSLLSTAILSLFIITCKVASSFFNLVLNTLSFVNFFSCYLFVHTLFTVEKKVSFSPQVYSTPQECHLGLSHFL